MIFTQNMELNFITYNMMPPTGCLAYSRGWLWSWVKV